MKTKQPEREKETYTEFVSRGGEIFPENLYPVKETKITKIKYI